MGLGGGITHTACMHASIKLNQSELSDLLLGVHQVV